MFGVGLVAGWLYIPQTWPYPLMAIDIHLNKLELQHKDSVFPHALECLFPLSNDEAAYPLIIEQYFPVI